MRLHTLALAAILLVAVAHPALAAVTVTSGPTSLVTSAMTAPASSPQIGLFSLRLGQTAGETLSSVPVIVTKTISSTLAGTDIASVSVYRDNGDDIFNPATDLIAGTQPSVLINATTTIPVSVNNSIATSTLFFVTTATSASWSDAAPADAFSIQLPENGIVTSANSPTSVAATTAVITADTTGPTLLSGPTSLFATPRTAGASSPQIGLFTFQFNQLSSETLSSVPILITRTASTTLAATDFASLSVYRDNGDGLFDPSTDLLAGSQSSILINATTSIPVTANNTIATSTRFFVSLATSASWSDVPPADAFYAVLPENGIATSTNSPTSSSATTSVVTADTTGPVLLSAIAKNTDGTSAKKPGDSIQLTFSEPTNTLTASSTNLMVLFTVNNGHSLLDSSGSIQSATWNGTGTILTIVLGGNASTTVASIQPGDAISVAIPSSIKDMLTNLATGTVVLTGSFGKGTGELGKRGACTNGLINGRLYRVQSESTIYLAAACRLKVFNGRAAIVARGKKFKNVISLPSLEGLTVQEKKQHINRESIESILRREFSRRSDDALRGKNSNDSDDENESSHNQNGKGNNSDQGKGNKGKK